MTLFHIADEHKKGVESFQRGMGVPQRHFQHRQVAGRHIDDNHWQLLVEAVHFVDQIVNEFHAVQRGLSSDHLPVAHAEKSRSGRPSGKVVNACVRTGVGFQATDKRCPSGAQRAQQHDATSRAELQITLQPKEHIFPAHQFTGLPRFERTDGKRVFIQTRQAKSMRFSSHDRATSSKYLLFHGNRSSEEPVSGC